MWAATNTVGWLVSELLATTKLASFGDKCARLECSLAAGACCCSKTFPSYRPVAAAAAVAAAVAAISVDTRLCSNLLFLGSYFELGQPVMHHCPLCWAAGLALEKSLVVPLFIAYCRISGGRPRVDARWWRDKEEAVDRSAAGIAGMRPGRMETGKPEFKLWL